MVFCQNSTLERRDLMSNKILITALVVFTPFCFAQNQGGMMNTGAGNTPNVHSVPGANPNAGANGAIEETHVGSMGTTSTDTNMATGTTQSTTVKKKKVNRRTKATGTTTDSTTVNTTTSGSVGTGTTSPVGSGVGVGVGTTNPAGARTGMGTTSPTTNK
jgi:hypothetical protein